MKKSVLTKIVFFVVAVISIFAVSATSISAANEKVYCYKYSVPALKATYEYLDEIYLEKYPDFGLTLHYGSPSDQQVIKEKALEITKDCKDDSERAMTIATWVKNNIKYYEDSTFQFPIDVFINKEADCLGFAYLMSDMMRSVGIVSVPTIGYRGNMIGTFDKSFITKKNWPGHAFVFAFVEGKWKFFDPLYDDFALTDSSYISKWCFITSIEGVMPYYSTINYSLHLFAAGIYKNGKTYAFSHTENCLLFNGDSSGVIANDSYNFNTTVKYQSSSQDGWNYVKNPERRNSMVNGECYANGWISYHNLAYLYKQPNGMDFNYLINRFDDKYVYSHNYILTNEIDEYFLKKGCLVVYDGEKIPFINMSIYTMPTDKMKVKYSFSDALNSCDGSGRGTVDKDGKIKVLKDGYIMLCIKVTDNNGSVFLDDALEIYITKTANFANCEYGQHIYKTVSEKNYCTSKGKIIKECVSCTKQKTIKTEPSGHKETVISAKKATYTSTGLTEGKKCTICNTVTLEQKKTKKLSLKKVKSLKAKSVKVANLSSVSLTWKSTKGAEKYEIYQYVKKKWKKIKTTSKTSYTVKNLKAGKSYKFKVRAVRASDNIKGDFSSVLTVKTSPKKVTLDTLKSKKKKQAVVTWKTVSGATGYEVKYSTSKKFTKKTTATTTVKKDKTNKITLKKLKSGKKYYVKVRAYKVVDGKKIYGSYSRKGTITIK